MPQFAAERELASSSLYQWIQAQRRGGRKQGKDGKDKQKPAPKAAFAEVNVVGQAVPRGPAMTVALRGSHSVTFEGPAVDPTWLASVLKVVSAC